MTKQSKHVVKFKERHALRDETIIAWSDGYIGEAMGSGSKAQKNGALIVTESRVIFYRKGLFGEVLETIPLKSLTSVERKSTMGFRVIRLHASHDDLEFKTFSKDGEAEVIAAIESGRSEQPISAPVNKEDSLDKLKKLAELKEMGAITQEEFDLKKTQLLADA
ncbi:SHOCT domain-containing protein [uncultured Amphritea sp.]|uniref:SHOCT domain-containing protein n=1 Tax=uncultured Amphritea sp. TaxID=981605 RepID=UPI0025EEEE3C|nr:SHOCT domain-containing protein [uncultured Amphritea sp.]